MILYATKQTIERFKIPMPEEMHPVPKAASLQLLAAEQGDPLLEWGVKMFYFERRKCIQVMNFASKFTIFLIDIKLSDFHEVPNLIAVYLLELYKDDPDMVKLLKRMFVHHSVCMFTKLTDKSVISSLNHNQSDFAQDGYRFYDYFEKNVLQTVRINHDFNFDWIVTQRINGKVEGIWPGKRLKELLIERFSRS